MKKTAVAPSEARSHIVKTLRRLSTTTSLRQLWDDWVEGMALALANFGGNSNPLLRDGVWIAREARYMQLVGRHGPEVWREIAGLYTVLVDLVEELHNYGTAPPMRQAWVGGGDPLGELFMELELGNDAGGQFFTPWSMCVVKAHMLMGDLPDLVEQLGFVTIEDPAVGSGTTLLAAAAHALELGINPQTQMRFHGRDISASAVHMAFVNCALRGLPAIIEHGDTLRMEIWSRWTTPAYILGGWSYRRQRQPVDHRQVLVDAVGRELPDALLVVAAHTLPTRSPEVEAAAEALTASLADEAAPEEFV